MLLQKALTRKPKGDFLVDILEAGSGIALACFLWTHLLFVSTMLLGKNVFNSLAKGLEDFYLAPIAIPAIIIIFLTHIFVAGRRIPVRYKEQKIIWNHAKLIGHKDTWTWVFFQVISGFAILILGSLHMFAVVSHWHIDSVIAMERAGGVYKWLYLILLFLGEMHASVGLYRIFVKWTSAKRGGVSTLLTIVTIGIIVLGIATWLVLTGLMAFGGVK